MEMKNKVSAIMNQMEMCRKYNADYFIFDEDLKLGIALNVKDGLLPINGLRINPEGDTSGWYIWAGEEFSTGPDFFVPYMQNILMNRYRT